MAQKFMTISGLGAAGIITDIAPVELPPGVITGGNNVRAMSSGLMATGGYELLTTAGAQFNPGFLIHNHVTDAALPTWVVAGDSSIFTYRDDRWSAASPADMPSVDLRKWSGCNLGKLTMLNNPDFMPLYIDLTEGPAASARALPFSFGVTWQDVDKTFRVIRTYKNFLFALNLTEDGIHYPDGYRWSHPADANGYPFTWDETDLSGLASRESLGGEDGEIIDGLALRDSFVIYSEHGIDVLDYTADDLLFKRRSLDTSAGLLSTECVAEVSGVHYFMSDGDIMVNDGSTVKSIMHDKVRKRFTNDLSDKYFDNSYVVLNDLFKEVWFCIPVDQSVNPNVAYTYNWYTGAWGRRDIADNVTFAAQGGVTLPDVTWGSAVGTWGSQSGTWGSRKISPAHETIVGCQSDTSALLMLEVAGANDQSYTAIVERTGMPLGGTRQVTTINALYPHMSGAAVVDIQVGSQDHPKGPIQWGPKVKFDAGVDRKVDVRTSGALHGYRVSSTGTATWRLTGMDIEYVDRGLR